MLARDRSRWARSPCSSLRSFRRKLAHRMRRVKPELTLREQGARPFLQERDQRVKVAARLDLRACDQKLRATVADREHRRQRRLIGTMAPEQLIAMQELALEP